MSVLSLHGVERKGRFGEIAEHDVVLTTYPLLWRDAHELTRHSYHLLILDEAQKAPDRIHFLREEALQTDALAALREAAGFWALETAPTQFSAVQPGALAQHMPNGQWRAYRDELAEPFAVLAPIAARLGYAD